MEATSKVWAGDVVRKTERDQRAEHVSHYVYRKSGHYHSDLFGNPAALRGSAIRVPLNTNGNGFEVVKRRMRPADACASSALFLLSSQRRTWSSSTSSPRSAFLNSLAQRAGPSAASLLQRAAQLP